MLFDMFLSSLSPSAKRLPPDRIEAGFVRPRCR